MKTKTPNNLTYLSCSQKISLVATSISALAVLPATAQATGITYFNTSNSFITNIAGNDVEWDIDNNGTIDFTLFHDKSTYSTRSSYGFGTGGAGEITVFRTDLGLKGATGNQLAFKLDSAGSRLANLPADTLVANTVSPPYELNNTSPFLLRDRPDGIANGNELVAREFSDQEDGFIGFVFKDNNDDLLAGWARIRMDVATGDITINEWAFENSPNTSINVGTTSVVPLPTAMPLALLGLGALGVTGWRSKRKSFNTHQ